MDDTDHSKPALWRRWLGIALRSAHLAAVCLLGAALLGAPLALPQAALAAVASGLVLLASELADARIRLSELAGWVVLAKLALLAWLAVDHAHAAALFWAALVMSALISHAPRELRHWRPGRRA